jgi:ABC-type lipoprotein release transport system permease subunit
LLIRGGILAVAGAILGLFISRLLFATLAPFYIFGTDVGLRDIPLRWSPAAFALGVLCAAFIVLLSKYKNSYTHFRRP